MNLFNKVKARILRSSEMVQDCMPGIMMMNYIGIIDLSKGDRCCTYYQTVDRVTRGLDLELSQVEIKDLLTLMLDRSKVLKEEQTAKILSVL